LADKLKMDLGTHFLPAPGQMSAVNSGSGVLEQDNLYVLC